MIISTGLQTVIKKKKKKKIIFYKFQKKKKKKKKVLITHFHLHWRLMSCCGFFQQDGVPSVSCLIGQACHRLGNGTLVFSQGLHYEESMVSVWCAIRPPFGHCVTSFGTQGISTLGGWVWNAHHPSPFQDSDWWSTAESNGHLWVSFLPQSDQNYGSCLKSHWNI